ncbi:amino acid adenylation domain-containing protein [Massilia sp. W12]|uniref:amino acid adenylation domain-containing protein n=1 Tax=Massilia sp. W12 TaxID=3126507 RepID=UPI0030CC1D8C
MNILLEFNQIAARFPEQLAIESGQGQLNYRQLQAALEQLRCTVEDMATGRMVVTFLPASLDLVKAALASMGAGKIFVPIEPNLPAARVASIFTQLTPGLIITHRAYLPQLQAALPPGAPLPPFLCLDDGPAALAPQARAAKPLSDDASHCYLYFTSGSTGTPKGVLGRSDSLLQFIAWEREALAVTPQDRVSLLTAQMFDPFLRDMLLPLLSGACLCIPPSREIVYAPQELLTWFSQQGVSISHMIPSLCQVLLEQSSAREHLQSLRVLALAGEMLKGALVARFFALGLPRARLFNFYGPTETTLAKFAYEATANDGVRAVIPVGKPISAASAFLLDESGRPVADGELGEVVISTPYMSAGYLHASPESAQRFAVGAPLEQGGHAELAGLPLYYTGDLGRRLASGDIELAGRKDFQIKIDGQRIELGEIENLLERHPDVQQAVVHYSEAADGHKVLLAYLTLRQNASCGANPGVAAWRAYLAPHLNSAAIPGHFQIEQQFPLLPNGKINRAALQPNIAPGTHAEAHSAAQWSPLQKQLHAIWQAVLPCRQINLEDHFFHLGGTSLLAIRMLAQVQALSGVAIPFPQFFQHASLAALAAMIENHGDSSAAQQPQAARNLLQPLHATRGIASSDQQRIVFAQHLAPHSCVYNMAYTAMWEGAIDASALQTALDGLVQSTPALRTRFLIEAGEAVAEIVPPEQANITITWVAPNSASKAADWLAQDAQRPFDLTQAPLLRIAILRLAPAEHVFYLCLHHAVADAWTLNLLWDRLLAYYQEAHDGTFQAAQDSSALTMLDVAAWQRQQLNTAEYEQARAYWLQQLAQLPGVAQLPYDKTLPQQPSQRGSRLAFSLPARLSSDLLAMAKAHAVTPYMLLLAAFAAFLRRYTQQSDVVIGAPLAQRQEAGLADIAGFLVNLLVMRQQVEPGSNFLSLLAQVRANVLAALQHQVMPFDKLVELLNPVREAGVSPLFQVMFAYQAAPPAARQVADQHVSALMQFDHGFAKYDLTLEIWQDAAHFSGVFEYACERFEAASISRMAANFASWLQAIVQQPSQAIGQLPLLCAAEQAELAAWNQTQAPFSDNLCIQQLIEQQAQATPDGIALVFQDTQLSYAELDAQANQLAHRLLALGVKPGLTVGISIERSPALVIGFLAILKAGGIYVPIDPDYPLERRRFMIDDAQLHLLLTQEKFLPVYQDVAVELVCWEQQAASLPDLPRSAPACQTTADDHAYIIYTSGSTGRPKGVLIRHRGVCNLAQAEIDLLQMTPASRVLQFASFSFDTSIWEIVMTLCAGGALVLAPAMQLLPGPDLLAVLQTQGVTHATLPASALAALPFAPLPDLEVLIVAGEACGLDLLRKWGPGRRFVNSYGPTEATVSASNAILPSDAERIHIGKPLHNTEIHILDADMQRLPIGVAGELYIGGIGLASGYHQRAELNAERFVKHPFAAQEGARLYRSGDLARWMADGNIEYLGRIDQQVKVRGFRVELGEIESQLRSAPAVRDAVAMVRADYLDATAIVAYVLLDAPDLENAAAILNQIQAQLRANLPDFMLPSVLLPLAAFPRLPNNKVDRARFPRPEQSSPATDAPPQGAVEVAIAEVWGRLLGRSAIGRHDSFFELGGHSLLAAKAAAILGADYGMQIGVGEVFAHHSIAALASRVQSASAPVLPETAVAPLSRAQQRMWFVEQMEAASSAYNIGVMWHFAADVKLELLQRSLALLVQRHAVFRTRLRVVADAAPSQTAAEQYHTNTTPPCQLLELGQLDAAQWQARVQEIAAQAIQSRFVLEEQALCRMQLLRANPASADSRLALLFVAHHILFDAASIDRFEHELQAIYTALLNGAEPALPASASYAAFAAWERSAASQARWQPQLDFWRQQYASLPPALNLPCDFARDAARESAHQGGCAHFVLERALSARIKALAAQAGTTPFNVILAAFQILLHRYCGERDFSIGVPVTVRPLAQVENTLGLFLNTLAMRAQLPAAGACDFFSLLQATHAHSSAALAHQEAPYELVLDAVDKNRSLAGQGLFQVMLAYAATAQQAGALPLRRENIDTPAAKFDLTLFVDEQPDHFSGKFSYRSALFLPDTMQRMAANFVHLMQEICANAHTPLRQLTGLAPAEQALLLQTWNATEAAMPALLPHQEFEAQVRRVPQAIALRYGEHSLTYAELNQEANRLARHLRQSGIGRESIVGLFLPRSELLVVAVLGVLKAGAAYLPIDASYPVQRLEYIVRDAQAQLLISCSELAAKLPAGSDTLLLDQARAALAACDAGDLDLPISATDLAYVIYTSGSTGQPKGVMIEQRGLSNYLAHAKAHYERADCIGNPVHSSISFDATITSLYLPLLCGKQLFIVPEEDEIACLSEVWQAQPRLSLAKITPAHVELLSKILPASAAAHTAVLVVGGEALHANALRFWREHAPAVRVVNEYGPTEATVGCCIYDIAAGDCPSGGALPIGRPIRNTQLYVLGEQMQLLPIGAVGELYIGGAGLARGYLHRAALSAERFVANPFSTDPAARLYKTGDLVRYSADGILHFLGRRDHQIKLRGYRIELGEIEACLNANSMISEAAVILHESHGRQHLYACVVLVDGLAEQGEQGAGGAGAQCAAVCGQVCPPIEAAIVQAIRQQLAAQLPSYMLPSKFIQIPAMPLTGNGKIDRAALAKVALAQAAPSAPAADSATPDAAPRASLSALEAALLEIWQALLPGQRLGVHDNFFALGGDSILSLQIIFKARQAGMHVTPRMVFEAPTIAELANLIALQQAQRPQSLAAAEVKGKQVLTPIQNWFFAHNQAQPEHFTQSFVFEVEPNLNLAALQSALNLALQHHDGLRTRYQQDSRAAWQADIAPMTASDVAPLTIACRAWPEDERQLADWFAQQQASLNLQAGPMMAALLVQKADQSRAVLLLLAHHLLIDGVSWRILLDDVLQAYAALLAGKTPQLPPKTCSFQHWAQQLSQHYLAPQTVRAGLAFWREYLSRPVASLTADAAALQQRNQVAQARKLSVTLPATEQLLASAPAAYHAKVSDLLLAAVLASLRACLGGKNWRIDLEGHGRDALDGADIELDVSRTVGWFTTLYPVCFALEEGQDGTPQALDALLKHVKQAVRSVPQAAFGWLAYGADEGQWPAQLARNSEICFNYLGRFDGDFIATPLLGVSALSGGARQAADNQRAHLLEIDAFVQGDSLTVEWTYQAELQCVAALSSEFTRQLQALLAHCAAQSRAHYTPCDFPLAKLSQAQTDVLAAKDAHLQDVYPLTPTQEGMLFHALQTPAASLYIEQICFSLTESVDAAALRAAWQSVAARHPALRTRFDLNSAGQPLQCVSSEVKLDWRAAHYAEMGQDLQDDAAALDAYLLIDRAEGFPLSAAPYRICLFDLPQGGQCMIFSHHHALLDGWSVQVLLDEVTQAYRGEAFKQSARPFRSYVQAQQQQQAAAQAHWRQRLQGLAEATPLPGARAVLATQDGIGRAEFLIDSQTQAALQHFARAQHITLSTLAQAAWGLLLQRYTGQDDCVFGVTVSGRAQALPGIENMVGLMISSLPCRVNLDGRQSLSDWLRQLQKAQQENEQHCSISLADMKQLAGLDWPGALFDSLLVFENYPGSRHDAPLFQFARAAERTNFPLTLVIAENQGLHGHLHYEHRYYTPAAAERLLAHFVQLLQAISTGAASRLAQVNMLTAEQEAALLAAWSPPPVPLFEGCAHHLFEQQARATPNHIALRYQDQAISYAELDQRAAQLARYLMAQGLQTEQLVAVFMSRSPDLVVALLAILKAGAAYIPIDAAYPAERVAYLLADSQAAILLTESQLAARLPADSGAGVQRLLLDQVLPALAATAQTAPAPDLPALKGSNLAYVIYTSGSTGLPKGVMIEHRGLVNYLSYARRSYGSGAHTLAFLHSSISFDATITSLWLPLVAGGAVIIIPDAQDATSLATQLSPTAELAQLAFDAPCKAAHLLKITPVHLELLGQTLPAGAAASVQAMVVGGEALPAASLQAWRDGAPQIRIFNEYGPTETVVGCCVYEVQPGEQLSGSVPIGQPIDNTQLYVLDSELRPVPFGASGELYIGGAGVARGYLGREALTQERFIANPFGPGRLYRSGDLVRALPDGNLDYVGRRDQQIKLRGYRIELGEIEAQLATHPALRQVALRLHKAANGAASDAQLVAYVVPHQPAQAPTAGQLREYLGQLLPQHMLPGHFVQMESMPQTANGKLDYKALPAPQIGVRPAMLAPRNSLEQSLQAIWCEVLQQQEIGVDDNFFDLGGHSLKALRMLARIEQQLNLSLSIKDVFEQTSIAQMAHLIGQRRKQGGSQMAASSASAPIARIAREGRRVSNMSKK